MSSERFLRDGAILAILVGVPLASYFLVFSPRNVEIDAARSEISAKRARLGDLNRLTARLGDLGREIEDRRDELERLDQKLPDREGIDGILEQVTQLAQKSALSVRSVKGDAPVAAGLAMELPLKMVIEGGFDGFYQFLLDVETLPRITRIHALKLSKPGAGPRAQPVDPASGEIRAEFTLSIYFDGAESPAAAGMNIQGGAR